MAHQDQIDFCTKVKNTFPERFKNCRVLDIGSLDINGNNRYLFSEYEYVGIDLGEGKNVDVVCLGHEYKDDKPFDIVITTECLEHDKFWAETFKNAIKLLKSGGLLVMSCASTGRPVHGTSTQHVEASPFSHKQFDDHYKNLTEADIRSVVDIEAEFSGFYFEFNPGYCDLYFWGVKK